jgi:hypothetical protein
MPRFSANIRTVLAAERCGSAASLRVRWSRLFGHVLPDHALVLVVRTNPHPDKTISILDGKRSMRQTNASRPEFTDFLEVQRRMVRIVFEQRIVLPRYILYIF